MIGPIPPDPSALFVVSGGARGVTAACVIEVARRFRCRFLLLGRSRLEPDEPTWARGCADEAALRARAARELGGAGSRPVPAAIAQAVRALLASREVAATLAAILAAGGQVEYLEVDIADPDALRRVLEPALRRSGPAIGLIHGAGVIADRRIEHKTAADYDLVHRTKVVGLANLLACIPAQTLSHLVLFSSAAGFFGNPGQADYAMANEVLNKAAYQLGRTNPSCRVVALDWGPWDGGMVGPALKAQFARRGIPVIPLARGADLLARLLAGEDSPPQLLVGDGMVPLVAPLDEALRTYRLCRTLRLEHNPFLHDHRIGAYAVLPMVCAAGWMADACEGIYPGYRTACLDDLQVLKGIVFDEGLAAEHTLDLIELEKDRASGTLRIEARISGQAAGGRTRHHYRAVLTLAAAPPAPRLYERLSLREDGTAVDGEVLYRTGVLFHGPSFRGVERVLRCTPEGLTMRCAVPSPDEVAQGQFPVGWLNPYAADVQQQAAVVWAMLQRGSASLPLCSERMEILAALAPGQPFYVSLEVRSSTDHGMVGDITSHDAQGRVYARVIGAAVTLSERLNHQFKEAVHP